MIATPLLDEGLLIDIEGTQYECICRSRDVFEFQSIDGMTCKTFDARSLIEAIATRRINVVPGRVAPNYVELDKSAPYDAGVIVTLSEENQRKLDIRAYFVHGIIERGISRGRLKLLEEAALELAREFNQNKRDNEPEVKAPSAPTLNRWLARFEKGSRRLERLIPGHVAVKRSKRVCSENEKIIAEVFEDLLFTNGVGKINVLFNAYLDRVAHANVERSLRQDAPILPVARTTFVGRFKKIPSFDRDAAIHGKQVARHNHRVASGKLPSSFALEFVEIDHGQIDLCVIDDILMIPLGIPWITILRDRYTGIVLGIYISFRQSSLQSVFGALRHSLRPHDRVRLLWPDIVSYWPFGLGSSYVMDRGADFVCSRLRLSLRALGSDAQYCEARVPWHKGPIERYIGQTNAHLIECMPGRTYPFRKAPQGYNAKKHAVVRFSSLVYLIHKWVSDVYHKTPHSRNLACPLERWESSVAQMPIPVVPPIDDVIVLTGEPVDRKISNEGIVNNWLTYTAPELTQICEDLGRVAVKFIPNPENLGFGMAIDPRSNTQFRVYCTTPEYANGLSEVQHAYIRRNAKLELRRHNVGDVLLRTQRELQESLANEILAKDSADKANLYKVAIRAGIDSNAVLDGSPRSVADLMSLADSAKQRMGIKALEEPVGSGAAPMSETSYYDWI